MSDAITRLLSEGEQPTVLMRPPRSRMRLAFAAIAGLGYAAAVLLVTLSPTPLDQGYRGAIDRVLGVLHRNGLPEWFGYGEVEFVANVVMFVPLGFLIGLLLGRLLWLGILIVPAFSAAVEVAQRLFLDARFASAQDVVANSIGGLMGLAFAGVLLALVHARDRRVTARALWDAQHGGRARA